MMTVTRKREGGSSQTLEKKWRSQTLEKKAPPVSSLPAQGIFFFGFGFVVVLHAQLGTGRRSWGEKYIC